MVVRRLADDLAFGTDASLFVGSAWSTPSRAPTSRAIRSR
jgi:hypothetical protein